MSLPVNVRPAAQRDLEEAARWYEAQRPGLAPSFSMNSCPSHRGLATPLRLIQRSADPPVEQCLGASRLVFSIGSPMT